MKKFLGLLLTIALLIVGCTTTNSADEKISIRGNITSIYIDKDNPYIRVEGNKDKDTEYDKAVVNITKDTVIQNKDKDKVYTVTDFELGMTVEIIFNGSVSESSPVKATAKTITIIN